MSKSTYEQSKKGIMKYLAEKTDHVSLTLPKGMKDTWRAAAEKEGLSLSRYIINAVEAALRADSDA